MPGYAKPEKYNSSDNMFVSACSTDCYCGAGEEGDNSTASGSDWNKKERRTAPNGCDRFSSQSAWGHLYGAHLPDVLRIKQLDRFNKVD